MPDLVEMFFQRFPVNEIHHQVPVFGVSKVVVDVRQVIMRKPREQCDLAVIGVGGLDHLTGVERTEIDLFDGYLSQLAFAVGVSRFIDNAESSLSYFTDDLVTVV